MSIVTSSVKERMSVKSSTIGEEEEKYSMLPRKGSLLCTIVECLEFEQHKVEASLLEKLQGQIQELQAKLAEYEQAGISTTAPISQTSEIQKETSWAETTRLGT